VSDEAHQVSGRPTYSNSKRVSTRMSMLPSTFFFARLAPSSSPPDIPALAYLSPLIAKSDSALSALSSRLVETLPFCVARAVSRPALKTQPATALQSLHTLASAYLLVLSPAFYAYCASLYQQHTPFTTTRVSTLIDTQWLPPSSPIIVHSLMTTFLIPRIRSNRSKRILTTASTHPHLSPATPLLPTNATVTLLHSTTLHHQSFILLIIS